MLHGKLHLCPFSAHAENLKAIPQTPEDSVNLNSKQLKEKIYNLYYGKEYLEACKHCNGRDHNVEKVEAAIQTKSPIKYNIVQ